MTLIPYVSDPAAATAAIRAANQAIRGMAQARGHTVIDMNPARAAGEIRKPEMMSDGIHLTEQAYTLWIAALREEASRLGLRGG